MAVRSNQAGYGDLSRSLTIMLWRNNGWPWNCYWYVINDPRMHRTVLAKPSFQQALIINLNLDEPFGETQGCMKSSLKSVLSWHLSTTHDCQLSDWPYLGQRLTEFVGEYVIIVTYLHLTSQLINDERKIPVVRQLVGKATCIHRRVWIRTWLPQTPPPKLDKEEFFYKLFWQKNSINTWSRTKFSHHKNDH